MQFGQRRVLLVWNRLILPNGRSIVLERQPGADSRGYAGLEDGVDYHFHVTDDWPEDVPVTEAEIDVFERYFGNVLDRLFGLAGAEGKDLKKLS